MSGVKMAELEMASAAAAEAWGGDWDEGTEAHGVDDAALAGTEVPRVGAGGRGGGAECDNKGWGAAAED